MLLLLLLEQRWSERKESTSRWKQLQAHAASQDGQKARARVLQSRIAQLRRCLCWQNPVAVSIIMSPVHCLHSHSPSCSGIISATDMPAVTVLLRRTRTTNDVIRQAATLLVGAIAPHQHKDNDQKFTFVITHHGHQHTSGPCTRVPACLHFTLGTWQTKTTVMTPASSVHTQAAIVIWQHQHCNSTVTQNTPHRRQPTSFTQKNPSCWRYGGSWKHGGPNTQHSLNEKLRYSWQTARRICTNAVACWPPKNTPPHVFRRQIR